MCPFARKARLAYGFLGLALLFCAFSAPGPARAQWVQAAPGLFAARFPYPGAQDGAPSILVVRANPSAVSLTLCTAAPDHAPLCVRDWAVSRGLWCAINASMYLPGGRSTGYMRHPGNVNNPRLNARFGAFLVFGPREPGLAPARLLDREHDHWRHLLDRYDSVVQNFRMISRGRVVWKPGGEAHPTACVAQDSAGNILFIHGRLATTVNAFAEALLSLPLDIVTAMYVEGGGQAALVLNTPELFLEHSGNCHGGGPPAPPCPGRVVPNVLGFCPHGAQTP